MSNFSHFWALYNKMPGRYEGFKEDLVLQFTEGRTKSLQQMHAHEYASLLAHLSDQLNAPAKTGNRKLVWSNINMDQCRKRVIAAISGYFTETGKEYSMNLVLSTAARAAKVGNFNLIPADGLRQVYNTFRSKQIDCQKAAAKERVKMNRLSMN